jgi:class 3 adenylate cyclase
VAAGTPPDVVDKAIRLGGTTLVQPVATAGLRAAQHGQTGTVRDIDYLGRPALEAYTPLTVPNSDLRWSIVATRNDSMVMAHERALAKTLVLTTTAIVFVMCLVALAFAQLFMRPIRRLEVGTQRISSGDYDVAVPVTSRDEIGHFTAAFNEMSRNLASKEAMLDELRRENGRLLLSLMPEPLAQRYRQGEQPIAQEHPDVTVIFADIVGLDETSDDLSGDELVGTMDELVRQFDAAAESLGVERIRTLHNGYLAGCGVTTPRLDNVHRTVEFAQEMQRIVDRFNSETGRSLALRGCISTGNAVSGLVGRSSVVYDMWGAAVRLAYEMHGGATQPGIYVTAPIYEMMRDTGQFSPLDPVTVDGSQHPIWRLSEQQ